MDGTSPLERRLTHAERTLLEVAAAMVVDHLGSDDATVGCAPFDLLPYLERLQRLEQALLVLLWPASAAPPQNVAPSLGVVAQALFQWIDDQIVSEMEHADAVEDFGDWGRPPMHSMRALVRWAYEATGRPLFTPEEQRAAYQRAVGSLVCRAVDALVGTSQLAATSGQGPAHASAARCSPPGSAEHDPAHELLMRLKRLTAVERMP